MKANRLTLLILAASALALSACKKEEAAPPPDATPPVAQTPPPAAVPAPAPAPAALSVTDVQLASSVGDDMRAVQPSTSFKPSDAIYAVVHTEGTGSHTLGARWTFGADHQPVHQEEHKIDATAAGVHNFRITKADGFPTGDYQVEITLDGAVASTRQFKVE